MGSGHPPRSALRYTRTIPGPGNKPPPGWSATSSELGWRDDCELIGEDVGGVAVHIGARVAALAEPCEVLVSSTVKDLVAGSGIEFDDRGIHVLKGIPGEWQLFAIRS